jgi:dipeptidyl aminopeptidase/acylaminoacyl peptidase
MAEAKDCGVFEKQWKDMGDPKPCSMGHFLYGSVPFEQDNTVVPIEDFQKAAYGNTWLVKRMSATESPNFYTTTDFKNFRQLTDVQPQKAYNWYTTQLHTWKSMGGTELPGVLYKPENFDSTKKISRYLLLL